MKSWYPHRELPHRGSAAMYQSCCQPSLIGVISHLDASSLGLVTAEV
jgi:hypothetical protein